MRTLYLLACALMSGCVGSTSTAPDADEPFSNVLKWRTASEVANLGYDIYRSTHPDGPFQRVTQVMIDGAGTSDLINQYRFEDNRIDPRTTYYYYIESISTDGVRKKFSAVKTAAAKIEQTADK